MWRRSLAIGGHDFALLRRDPFPLGLLLVAPVIFVPFLRPSGLLALVVDGYSGTNGSEQAVPGVAVAFSLLVAGLVGVNFFREQSWGTWPRLLASAGVTEILAGKVVLLLAFAVVQLMFLFGVGALLFDLSVRGSVAALAAFCVPVAFCSVALGLALVATCRSLAQLHAATNIGAAFFSGIGGALVPVRLLPGWARAIGPVSPAFWAMRGYRAVILDGGGAVSLVRPTLALLLFSGTAMAIAGWRLRVSALGAARSSG